MKPFKIAIIILIILIMALSVYLYSQPELYNDYQDVAPLWIDNNTFMFYRTNGLIYKFNTKNRKLSKLANPGEEAQKKNITNNIDVYGILPVSFGGILLDYNITYNYNTNSIKTLPFSYGSFRTHFVDSQYCIVIDKVKNRNYYDAYYQIVKYSTMEKRQVRIPMNKEEIQGSVSATPYSDCSSVIFFELMDMKKKKTILYLYNFDKDCITKKIEFSEPGFPVIDNKRKILYFIQRSLSYDNNIIFYNLITNERKIIQSDSLYLCHNNICLRNDKIFLLREGITLKEWEPKLKDGSYTSDQSLLNPAPRNFTIYNLPGLTAPKNIDLQNRISGTIKFFDVNNAGDTIVFSENSNGSIYTLDIETNNLMKCTSPGLLLHLMKK